MRKRRIPIFVSLIGVVLATLCSRITLAESLLEGSRYLSARALAMGNNILGVGDDLGYALFTSPTLLADSQKLQLEAVNLVVMTGVNTVDIFNLSILNSLNLQSAKPTLDEFAGTYASNGGQYLMGVMYSHFALGVLAKAELAAQDYGTGLLYYRANYQLIPAAAVGFKLFKGRLKVGYGIQWVNQTNGQNEVATTDSTASFNNNLNQGAGLSHTLGLSYQKKGKNTPQFNLVVRNLMGVQYTSQSLLSLSTAPLGPPATESMTFDASMSGNFSLGSRIGLKYVLQISDMTGVYGTPPLERLGLGLEFGAKNPRNAKFSLRAGWGKGYPSGGISFIGKKTDVSITGFIRDVGLTYHEYGDFNILLQFQLRYGKAHGGYVYGGSGR